jgi:hypothetical protein
MIDVPGILLIDYKSKCGKISSEILSNRILTVQWCYRKEKKLILVCFGLF